MKNKLENLLETCVYRINAWERHLYCHSAWHDLDFELGNPIGSTDYIIDNKFDSDDAIRLIQFIENGCDYDELQADDSLEEIVDELRENHNGLGEYLAQRWRDAKEDIELTIEDIPTLVGTLLINKSTGEVFAAFYNDGKTYSLKGNFFNRTHSFIEEVEGDNVAALVGAKEAESFRVEYTFADGSFED